jgi:hypothetical protein
MLAVCTVIRGCRVGGARDRAAPQEKERLTFGCHAPASLSSPRSSCTGRPSRSPSSATRSAADAASRLPGRMRAFPVLVHQYATESLDYSPLSADTRRDATRATPRQNIVYGRQRASYRDSLPNLTEATIARAYDAVRRDRGRETVTPFAWNIRDLQCYSMSSGCTENTHLVRNLVRLLFGFLAPEKHKRREVAAHESFRLAGPTGLEPATSGVTGRRSNQLNYDPAVVGILLTLRGATAFPEEARIVNSGREGVKTKRPRLPRAAERTRLWWRGRGN